MPSAKQFTGGGYLKAEDVNGIMYSVLTSVDEVTGNFGPQLVGTMYPEVAGKNKVNLNTTSVGKLIEAYGEDYDNWNGKHIKIGLGSYTDKKSGMEKKFVVVGASNAQESGINTAAESASANVPVGDSPAAGEQGDLPF